MSKRGNLTMQTEMSQMESTGQNDSCKGYPDLKRIV